MPERTGREALHRLSGDRGKRTLRTRLPSKGYPWAVCRRAGTAAAPWPHRRPNAGSLASVAEDREAPTQTDSSEAKDSEEFDRFEELTRRLVAVPKSEVDAARAVRRPKPAK